MKEIKFVLTAALIVIILFTLGVLNDDIWYPIRVMQNSSDSLGFLYAVLGVAAGYVLKNGAVRKLYMPFAGTVGILLSSLLAGGVDIGQNFGLGHAFISVMGMVFILSVLLVIHFVYSVILSAHRNEVASIKED